MTEDEMVGRHHQFNGHEFQQIPGDREGQGSLTCCSPRGCKESDITERLNNNSKIIETHHLLGKKDKNMNIGSEILYLAFLFFSSSDCLVSRSNSSDGLIFWSFCSAFPRFQHIETQFSQRHVGRVTWKPSRDRVKTSCA